MAMPKRRRIVDDEVEEEDATPRKSKRIGKQSQDGNVASDSVETPLNRKSVLRNGLKALEGETTPTGLRRVLFSTQAKPSTDKEEDGTPTAVRNDRSARKKSARTLQNRVEEGESEDDEDVQDTAIAREILDEDGERDSDADIAEETEAPSFPSTPSKRGRPKGRRRERTPSPPPDLPPHELYFFQNCTGANKTSANTLPSKLLLNHEDYFSQINAYKDPHERDIKRLRALHRRAFDQWSFELEERFNICLYGYGSKRELVMQFAEHIYTQAKKTPKIAVVNGYTPGLTIRDILTTVASLILPKTTKLPAQPTATVDLILSHLESTPPASPIHCIIHSLDHRNLRKPTTQSLLARLAANNHINLIAACDTTNFGLLWDTSLLRQFRWLYHDATTFEPYNVEVDVVEEVNALLGRSGRRLGGKDGVGYVLKSLPENARNLFRMLVAEQLALADENGDGTLGAAEGGDDDSILGASDEELAIAEQNTPSRRRSKKKSKPKVTKPVSKPAAVAAPVGVEYRTLYHKAVEEFVCSSELNFRTLLKEFHDHAMLESRKDALGTERLSVPLGREELEAVLEELV